MPWWDHYKLFHYSFEEDPQTKLKKMRDLTGAGHSQPDALPDIRAQDGSYWGGGRGLVRLRDSQDFIDLSTVSNRQSRYKEYERLRNVPEIETAMTVFADEACLAGHTKIASPFYGLQPIRWFAENKADERFLVYCWDFDKEDYTLGWAYDPRKVKTAKTIRIKLDDGTAFVVTHDHRILMRSGEWRMAGELRYGDELMPFYRLKAARYFNEKEGLIKQQFPRIYTFQDGWKHERQFIDEWRLGRAEEQYKKVNQACRILTSGIPILECAKMMGHRWNSINSWIHKEGFSLKELRYLGRKEDRRRVLHVEEWKEQDVYDLSVEDHQNFCGESAVFHNCQKGENEHVFEIKCGNEEIQKELEWLFFHRKMLNLDRRAWHWMKQLCIFGDSFLEVVIDPESPKDGILKMQELPPDSMYRIETTKGKLIEFQQSNEGPDYQSLTRPPVTQATETDLQQATALRFAARQVIHFKTGDDRKTFYPYGVSLIEPARGPAHQLRLMEDAMVVYRLCLVGDSRIRTIHGWKYIKDITTNDVGYCLWNNEVVPTGIEAHLNNGIQTVYSVKSRHVEIKGNDIHPILVLRNGKHQYVKIKDIKPKKDKIINVAHASNELVEIPQIYGDKWAKLEWSQRCAFRNGCYENKTEIMRQCSAKTDRVKQFLCTDGKALPFNQAVEICEKFDLDPSKLQIVNKGQTNAERINTPQYVDAEFAELFGFMLGDGSIRSNGFQLSFAAGVDEETNEHYANLLKKYFGKVRFEPEKRVRKHQTGNFVVDSQAACKIFIKLGFIRGAKNKRIPEWAYNTSAEIRQSIIRGLSNADGCERRTKAGTWFSTIELCNKQLVEDVKELWHSIGLCSGHIKKRKRKGGHEIEPGRIMKPSISYSVTISEKPLPKCENVISVEHAGEESVYDLTVCHHAHNFIVNGTCTSNTRAPERRVFYIDVGQLPPFKAEAFMERMKDQFRKKKVANTRSGSQGASAIEERWHAPSADEDYWIPIRPNANTRVETLPGAQNLGEIDDAVYFRNKLYTALNFPKNYQASEDPQATRITLSAQDVKFAKLIERLQGNLVDGILQIAETHLELRGYPEDEYEDVEIIMTPPSAWRELSFQEIVTNRINNANALKGSMLMSDFDILCKWMKYSEDEVLEMLSRNKIQKLEDLKLQIIGQNPQLLGVGTPGEEGEPQMGTEAGGPNPMLGPEGQPPPGGEETGGTPMPAEQPPQGGAGGASAALAEPTPEEIKKYDLEIQNYASQIDDEEVDFSELQ